MPNILDLIPYGKENAITKQELANQLNTTDRNIRYEVAELRKSGEVIISSSHGKGYYRPKSCEASEVVKFVSEQMSRADEIRRSTNGARNWLKGQCGQQEMDLGA